MNQVRAADVYRHARLADAMTVLRILISD